MIFWQKKQNFIITWYERRRLTVLQMAIHLYIRLKFQIYRRRTLSTRTFSTCNKFLALLTYYRRAHRIFMYIRDLMLENIYDIPIGWIGLRFHYRSVRMRSTETILLLVAKRFSIHLYCIIPGVQPSVRHSAGYKTR